MKKIISILLAVFLVLSAVATVVMASPGIIQEPGFETINSWTYSESNSNYNDGQSTDWQTQGVYSYKFYSTKSPLLNSYCQVAQLVNFTYLDTISFDARLWAEEDNRFEAAVYVGATKVWSRICTTVATEYLHQAINVSGYTGSYDLVLRVTCIDAGTPFNLNDQTNYFDNIKTWGSFSDIDHTVICNDFSDYGTEHIAYMFGEGFTPSTTYRVIFWDQVDASWYNRETQDRDTGVDGSLSAQHIFVAGVDTGGIWYAAIYNNTSHEPVAYDPNDAYLVVADDFQAQESAIPEFPTILSGLVVTAVCAAIYCWMRKRRLLKDVEV